MAWLSERLKELLKERQLSIQAVARTLKVERAYLSQIVNDVRVPSDEVVRKLASYFDEDPEEWAFKTKGQPVIDELRRKYPNVAPQYMRTVTENPLDKEPRQK